MHKPDERLLLRVSTVSFNSRSERGNCIGMSLESELLQILQEERGDLLRLR